MPMKSVAQRGLLWATKPELARIFEDHTPKGIKLPKKLHPEKTVKAGELLEYVCPGLQQALSIGRGALAEESLRKAAGATPPAHPIRVGSRQDSTDFAPVTTGGSILDDLPLTEDEKIAEYAAFHAKAAAILGPLALKALGPDAPQATGPAMMPHEETPYVPPDGGSILPAAGSANQIPPPIGMAAPPGAAPVPGAPPTSQPPAAPPAIQPPAIQQPAAQPKTASITQPGPMGASVLHRGQPTSLPAGPGLPAASSPSPQGLAGVGAAMATMGQAPSPSANTLTAPAPVAVPNLGMGGRNSPGANPINSYGPISASGEINGNAAFGAQNSSTPIKLAGTQLGTKLGMAAPAPPPRKNKRGLPGWIAPTGAVGAAALGGAYGLASDQQATGLQQAMDKYKQPLEPNETALTHYEELMSHGAQMRPFGVPAGELLAKVRSSPYVMGRLGAADYAATTPASLQEARAHYDQFRKGPIAAFSHQIGAKGTGVPVSPALAAGENPPKDYADLIGKKFEPYFRGKTNTSWLSPHEVDTQYMPQADQTKMLREFYDSLPPELQAERQRVETELWGPGLQKNTGNYAPAIQGGLKVRSALQNTGAVAGGAAAGGAAGYYLHRVLAGKKRKGFGSALATTAGAGLGGAAAYLGGTTDGRQLVQSALQRLTQKAALAESPARQRIWQEHEELTAKQPIPPKRKRRQRIGVKVPLLQKAAEGLLGMKPEQNLPDTIATPLMKGLGVHAGPGGTFGPQPLPPRPAFAPVTPLTRRVINYSDAADVSAGRPSPSLTNDSQGDITSNAMVQGGRDRGFHSYSPDQQSQFLDPWEAEIASFNDHPWPSHVEDTRGAAQLYRAGPQPLHGQGTRFNFEDSKARERSLAAMPAKQPPPAPISLQKGASDRYTKEIVGPASAAPFMRSLGFGLVRQQGDQATFVEQRLALQKAAEGLLDDGAAGPSKPFAPQLQKAPAAPAVGRGAPKMKAAPYKPTPVPGLNAAESLPSLARLPPTATIEPHEQARWLRPENQFTPAPATPVARRELPAHLASSTMTAFQQQHAPLQNVTEGARLFGAQPTFGSDRNTQQMLNTADQHFPLEQTQESLAQNVGRYYGDEAGYQQAVDDAQYWQQQPRPGLEAFEKWKPEALDRKIPTVWRGTAPDTVPRALAVDGKDDRARGLAGSDGQAVSLPPGATAATRTMEDQVSLEHELTHGLTAPRPKPDNSPARLGITTGKYDSLESPTELDPRLAEIKRYYTQTTGRPVDSPEEAQQAWDWWSKEDTSVVPTSYGDPTKLRLTPEQKQVLQRRMLELVQQPSAPEKFAAALVLSLRKTAKVSAAGEGAIPYTEKPWSSSIALPEKQYVRVNPQRLDSILPPRYTDASEGRKTDTSKN